MPSPTPSTARSVPTGHQRVDGSTEWSKLVCGATGPAFAGRTMLCDVCSRDNDLPAELPPPWQVGTLRALMTRRSDGQTLGRPVPVNDSLPPPDLSVCPSDRLSA